MECPRCGLINPIVAGRSDCGREFTIGPPPRFSSRSIGVTIGGIILLLQSATAFGYLVYLLWAVVVLQRTGVQHLFVLFSLGMVGGFLALTATSAIGLFRLRPWARRLILLMAGVGLVLNVRNILLLIVHQPAGSLTRTVLFSSYAVGLGLSIWWLILLKRPSVEQQFLEHGRRHRA